MTTDGRMTNGDVPKPKKGRTLVEADLTDPARSRVTTFDVESKVKVPVIEHGTLVDAFRYAEGHGVRLGSVVRRVMENHAKAVQTALDASVNESAMLRKRLAEFENMMHHAAQVTVETDERAKAASERADVLYDKAVFGQRQAKVIQVIAVRRPDPATGRHEAGHITDLYTLDGRLIVTGGSKHGGDWNAFGHDRGRMDLF